MKLEIIKTTETDGRWYKVTLDGACKEAFKICASQPDEQAKERALRAYQEYLDLAIEGLKTEVIKSTEI